MKPLISVIIPIYNSEEFLHETIESVLSQKQNNVEIILVDDASTDRSNNVCEEFSSANSNIKIVQHKNNLGVAASRNSGIERAEGEYLIFLDSDDCLYPESLKHIALVIEENQGMEVIVGKWNSNTPESLLGDHITNCSDPEDMIKELNSIKFFIGFCWRYITRRDFVLKNKLFFINAKIHEDIDFVVRMLCLCQNFSVLSGDFYCKKMRKNSISGLTDVDSTYSCLKIAQNMSEFIHHNSTLSKAKLSFINSKIRFILFYFTPRLLLQNLENINKISNLLENELNLCNTHKHLISQSDLYKSIKKDGVHNGLINYKSSVTKQTLSRIANKAHTELYIFCAGLFGEATANTFLENGIPIAGILDNGKAFQGESILGLNIGSPETLVNKSKKELSQTLLVVCNQRPEHIKAISDQLQRIGIKEKQIVNQVY